VLFYRIYCCRHQEEGNRYQEKKEKFAYSTIKCYICIKKQRDIIMAFIRFIDNGYKILGERNVEEINGVGFYEKVREHIKEFNNPKCVCALYWTDKDLERGYNHPYSIVTKEYEDYLRKIGRY